jgi:hypothetical protein
MYVFGQQSDGWFRAWLSYSKHNETKPSLCHFDHCLVVHGLSR